MINIIDL